MITKDVKSAAFVNGWTITHRWDEGRRAVMENGDRCIHINGSTARAYRGNLLTALLSGSKQLASYLREGGE